MESISGAARLGTASNRASSKMDVLRLLNRRHGPGQLSTLYFSSVNVPGFKVRARLSGVIQTNFSGGRREGLMTTQKNAVMNRSPARHQTSLDLRVRPVSGDIVLKHARPGLVSFRRVAASVGGFSPPPKQARGKKEQGANEGKDCVQSDADEAKGDGQKPDKGKQHQSEQRQRPAKHEQNAPADDKNQQLHTPIFSCFGQTSITFISAFSVSKLRLE